MALDLTLKMYLSKGFKGATNDIQKYGTALWIYPSNSYRVAWIEIRYVVSAVKEYQKPSKH